MCFTKSKQNLLDVRISDKLPDIICLQNIVIPLPKAESYQIKDYNFNKRDICIYSKPHIYVTVLDYTYAFQEYIWCSVSPSKGEKVALCCIYRSPFKCRCY